MASAAGAAATTSQCEETARLLRVYSFAKSDHSRAVMVLHEYSGEMSRTDYEEILSFAEMARELAEHARAELDLHLIEHGCF